MLIKVMAIMQSLLFLISSVLLYPVIVSLVVLFLWVLFETGKTMGELISRKNIRTRRLATFQKELEEILDCHGPDEARIHMLLHTWEEKLYKDIDRLRILVRISPSLGLMGTLIPMSNGLASLSKGNMEGLVSSLIVALTTTVVGLAIAVISYILGSAKQRWTSQDLKQMEFFAEQVFKNASEIHET